MRITPLAESSVPGTGFCSETRLGLLPGASTLPDNAMPCSISQMVPESNLHLYDTEERPGVPAGIVVSIEETRDEAKTRIRDETLEDDPEHDSAGHLLEDEHYAGLTYLGTLDKIRSELEVGTRDWVATQISTVVVSGALPEVQFNDVFTFLSNTVLGKTQIDCLELDCDGTHAHLWTGTPTDDDLQCNQCGSEAVVAVDTQPSDSAQ